MTDNSNRFSTKVVALSYLMILLMVILLVETPYKEGKQPKENPIILVHLGESFEKEFKKMIQNILDNAKKKAKPQQKYCKNPNTKKPKYNYNGKHKFQRYMLTN